MQHLLERIDVLSARIRDHLRGGETADSLPRDPFRGLHVSSADVLRIADGAGQRPPAPDHGAVRRVETRAGQAESHGNDLRLLRLARTFGLDATAVEVFLAILAPDLDRRFESYYGYLHDDVSRRYATPWLALQLAGRAPSDPAARALLHPDGALVGSGLVVVGEQERPFLTRSLRVAERVCQHLLGDNRPAAEVQRIDAGVPLSLVGDAAALAGSLARRSRLVYLRDADGAAPGWARAAFEQLGMGTLVLDLEQLDLNDQPAAVLRMALLESRLSGRGLVAGPIDVVARHSAPSVRAITSLPGALVLYGNRSWEPAWANEVPLELTVPAVPDEARADLWRTVLDGRWETGLDPATATSTFRLAPDAVVRAARSAMLQAGHLGRPVSAEDLRAGARRQNGAGLEQLAHRISPAVRLADLVLPHEQHELVSEVVARARRRSTVLDAWGMRQTGRRGDGISALFAGPPGTGKTMAVEAVAGELGLDVYTVELASVVDKYIGETEKNLERIFDQAERINGVLFFDEADALFGKRSEVSDARDRYANVEVAYLLQRMEAFNGLAVLATNLRVNLDEAFTRRLDVVVEFPLPGKEERLNLWRRSFAAAVPVSDDLDFEFCAASFEMSGGDIRNVAMSAAYLAADAERAVTMADVILAIQREYRKLGRLLVESEFGRYWAPVADSSDER
ncbi:ATP-binding protein [Kribbella sp. CA-253562]|uniref:ATP-binding protein n=1 Tax=Kribbella sp. CA-253562 TaxID=3239942 RepID=UPI003D89E8E7